MEATVGGRHQELGGRRLHEVQQARQNDVGRDCALIVSGTVDVLIDDEVRPWL